MVQGISHGWRAEAVDSQPYTTTLLTIITGDQVMAIPFLFH